MSKAVMGTEVPEKLAGIEVGNNGGATTQPLIASYTPTGRRGIPPSDLAAATTASR